MNKQLRCILSILVFLSMASLVSAQNTAEGAADLKKAAGLLKTPPLRALAVGFFPDLGELEILDENRQSVGKLKLRLQRYSRAFECPIVKGHLIFGAEDGMDEFGNKVYKPVAVVKWNGKSQQVCLVFVPQAFIQNNTSKELYKIMAMDMDASQFKLGHTRVANFTPVQTMFRFGEHKKVIESGKIIEIPKVKELKQMNMAQVDVYYSFDGKTNTILQTRQRYLERIRYFAIIYPDFATKQIQMAMVPDFGSLYP